MPLVYVSGFIHHFRIFSFRPRLARVGVCLLVPLGWPSSNANQAMLIFVFYYSKSIYLQQQILTIFAYFRYTMAKKTIYKIDEMDKMDIEQLEGLE